MNRFLSKKLDSWRNNPHRLPIILKGARQVGKTFLVKDFGAKHFASVFEFNFETSPKLKSLFDGEIEPRALLRNLELITGRKITPQDLIFFDEIQECPRALTSLKHFAERLPEQPIISAGSLLGITLPDLSFPVGKVEYLWLGPLSFEEFLAGIGDNKGHAILRELIQTLRISAPAHDYLWNQLKLFYVTGGLPKPILALANKLSDLPAAFTDVRAVQEGLIRDYTSDFSKYIGQVNAVHVRAVYENIPEQLSSSEDRTTKKYTFSNVVKGQRGLAGLASPIEWLVRAGLIYKVKIANRAELPLASFCKDNFFKLYHFDVGILGALLRLPPAVLIQDDYGMARGYFAESVALQGLVKDDLSTPHCWMEAQSEIEFLLTSNQGVLPVEIKASSRTKAKSIDSFVKRYKPNIAYKLGNYLPKFNAATKVQCLPLYLAWSLDEIKR